MKKTKSFIALLLMLVLTLSLSGTALAIAKAPSDKGNSSVNASASKDTADTEDADATGEDEENDTKEPNAWQVEKARIEQEKDEIEIQKDLLEQEKTQLEAQYEQAVASGDEALVASLNEQIDALKEQLASCKTEMKEHIELMQAMAREKYTEEELAQLAATSESLNELEGVDALPVENVLVKGGDIKFDTPPVIKEGRVLIPVRAVSEAMGASVDWNSETKIVTIEDEDTTIIFDLANGTVLVNGVETAIDVPAEIMNDRTMVPIRFISENLGFEIEWDSETQTVELALDAAET